MNRRPPQTRQNIRRGWAWLLLSAAVLLAASSPGAASEEAAEAPSKTYSKAVLIRFEGPIGYRLHGYFRQKLEDAKLAGADLVILEIESPGGYVRESVDIATRMRDADWAHTVAYVPREALSGAAIAALGCDEIVMGPTAKLGDAGAIYMDEFGQFQYAQEKVRSHLATEIRGLAEAGGRPPALAEAMVDMDLIVYKVKNTETGEATYMSEAEIESSDQPEVWQKLQPVHESREKHFLEVSGPRAVELGLAEANLASREELAARYGVQGNLKIVEYTNVDLTVFILNSWFVTGLLVVIGMIALYVEFSMPGVGVGILVAGLCFSIFFWSRFLGGTAGWLEVILFLAGLTFLAVELFVFPGFGVSGLTGFLLLLASLILASHRFIIPRTDQEFAELTGSMMVLAVSFVVVGGSVLVLSRYFGSLPLLSRLTLQPPEATEQGAAEGATGVGVQLGDLGTTESYLRPAGKAHFGGRLVDVMTEGDFIARGEAVKIVEIRGSRVVVSAAAEETA